VHYNHPLVAVLAIGVLAPLLAEFAGGLRLPGAVIEMLLGMVIGPDLLGLVQPSDYLSVMTKIGTGAMLFMVGMEIEFERVRGRPLSLALAGWFTSASLALLAVLLLHLIPGVDAPLMVAIALSTTGLSILLPGLRDGGRLDEPTGRLLFAAGAVGDAAPIIAVSLALSRRYTSVQEFGFLIVFLCLVGTFLAIGMRARPPAVVQLLSRTLNASTQLPVRLALLLMAVLVTVALDFGFEAILGTFAAGMIVGIATRGPEGERFRSKIDAVCFGSLTPFFFVGTGITFDLAAVTQSTTTGAAIPLLLALFLLCRGAPIFIYGRDVPKRERLSFALSMAVPSPGLVVVIAQIGVQTGQMNPDISRALIAAAMIAALLFPTLAALLQPRDAKATPKSSA
jgi:Kef-type K+ transport system membrane component KefB